MAVLIIEDLVSRKWLAEIVSAEETHTQVELAFTAALEAEALMDAGPIAESERVRRALGAHRP